MEYRLIYKDKNGIENSILKSDGKNLIAELRGVTFRGSSFDLLEPEIGSESPMLNSFTLCHGDLCNCIIECFIDISVVENDNVIDGQIKVVLELGNEAQNGALDNETLSLTLFYNDSTIKSLGLSGYFEDELLEIQKKLPVGTFMKACINCAYSDYSPYGSGLFGTMMCFRNLKQEYLCVKSKDELWAIHDRYDSLVQETYCCSDFSKRCSGTGYRG